MTTIIALHDGKKIHMVSDRRITTEQRMPHMDTRKLCEFNSGWLVGMAGNMSVLARMHHQLASCIGRVQTLAMLHDAIDISHKNLVSNGMHPNYDEAPMGTVGVEMLLARPLGLFHVTEDRAVLPIIENGWWAIGSGAKHALGAMAATIGMEARERLLIAMNAAVMYDPSTGPYYDWEQIDVAQ